MARYRVQGRRSSDSRENVAHYLLEQNQEDLGRDVADLERAQDGSPVKTYRFLVAAMNGYIDRDLRNRFMRQREHELKISTSGLASAMPSVGDSAPSPQQRNRSRKKKHTGDRHPGSRSGSGSRSASRDSGKSSGKSFPRRSPVGRHKGSDNKSRRSDPRRDNGVKPKAAPSEALSGPTIPTKNSSILPHSDKDQNVAMPADT